MKLSSLFSDHMVLQNGEDLPVWGWSKPGDEITVKYIPGKNCKNKKQTKKTITAKNGKWTLKLDAMSVSTKGAQLVASSKKSKISLEANDILVGEVWLASGQSNMEWVVQNSVNSDKEIAAAKWPEIRMFTAPKRTDEKMVENINSNWEVCSPATVAKFSAVAYFFGREIHQKEKTPVGLLNISWGGSRVETWISKNGLMAEESTRKETSEYQIELAKGDVKERIANRDEFTADPIAWLKKRVKADPGNKAFAKGWADQEFDDSDWSEMKIPNVWQAGGIPENGIVWFRKSISIPKEWAGQDLQVTLGACDKHDVTYFNNEKIGSIGWELYDPWNITRIYTIPGHLVKKGENLLTVRVYSYRNGGGLTGPQNEMRIRLLKGKNKKEIDISGQWKMKMEHNFGVIKSTNIEPGNNPNAPHTLYNSMIHPVIPYGIKGFIWYQGESNAGNAAAYRDLFPQMIREWRSDWGGNNLPFIFVQLANYVSSGTWPYLREAQTFSLKEPNTGMAVTIDIGDAIDIHPKNKQDVGKRLALSAEHLAYGRDLVYSGPLYRNFAVKDTSILIWFDHAIGLSAKGKGPIKGFLIAGEDKVFAEAKANVEGDAIIVSSPKVKKPIAVRYAWEDNPTCNLINKAGLPASPFRTDNWK
jgi:sialate O-acetylesterase